jgi:hypothetical protein
MIGRRSAWRVGVWAGLVGAGACGVGGAVVGDRAGGGDGQASPARCAPLTIRDPGFMTSDAWTTTGSAQVTFGSAGFSNDTRCDFGGISQTVPAPAVSCAWPPVLDIQGTFLPLALTQAGSISVRVNGGWNFFQPSAGTTTTRICLGPRAFGGVADLFIGAGLPPYGCTIQQVDLSAAAFELTNVSVDADDRGACPPFATVRNGDFEAGATGWALVADAATAEIAPGVGDGGSFGARLAATHACSQPRLQGTASLPLATMVPNPALRVWSRGTPGAMMSLLIGGLPGQETYLRSTGEARVETVCVPPWAQGTVQSLLFGFLDTNGLCDEPLAREVVLDDLGFVSDPNCAGEPNLRDGGFEQAASASTTASSWLLRPNVQDTGGDVALHVDAGFAHTGQVAALLTAETPCSAAALEASVTVPTPTATAGPAVVLWYKTNALADAQIGLTLTSLLTTVPFPAASAWTRVSACLDPRQAGRPDRLSIVVSGNGGECATLDDVPDTVAIDDVSLTTDPACPTR